jgi:predicted Mrr-cat superfamily restriction endonuclease
MNQFTDSQQAFVLRIAPGGNDCVPEALKTNDLIIGWSECDGLLDTNLTWKAFREKLRRKFYSDDKDLRRAGNATGYLWRFIREMKPGDLVVVPHGGEFYVGEVTGPARYEKAKVAHDTAYRRSVQWLTKRPVPRSYARAALQSRMKIQGTCADAADLLDEIKEALKTSTTFGEDLHKLLVQHTVEEMQSGKMDGGKFEQFIASLLRGLGANEARVVPHNQDKGADIIASFRIAGAFQIVVAVQAKHYRPEPPVGKRVVEELFIGMIAESADVGMIVTCGTISQEAIDLAQKLYEERGIKIELVDGDQLGALIIENGLTKGLLPKSC